MSMKCPLGVLEVIFERNNIDSLCPGLKEVTLLQKSK